MLDITLVIGFICFYTAIHFLTESHLVPLLDQKAVANLDGNDRVDLPEKVPSTINGVFIGVLSIYALFVEQVFKGDVINPYPHIIDILFASYLGYTIYDLGVMYSKPKEDASMWIHHWVGLTGAILMPIYRQGAFFPVVFMLTEITVIPTNYVWFLQRMNLKDTPLYSSGLAYRALFFLIFRPFTAPYLIYYSLNNPGDLNGYTSTLLSHYINPITQQLPTNILNLMTYSEKYAALSSNLSQIPGIIVTLSGLFAFLLALLNTVWTVVIVSNYCTRLFSKKKSKFFDPIDNSLPTAVKAE